MIDAKREVVVERIGLNDEVFLSFLPLSHAYEHTAGQFLPMAVGAEIYYADGLESLAGNFVEVRPTIIACVPRLYEVIRERMARMLDVADTAEVACVSGDIDIRGVRKELECAVVSGNITVDVDALSLKVYRADEAIPARTVGIPIASIIEPRFW